jgi:XTP/dITP diphosphohydrolase
MRQRLLIGSNNQKKLAELEALTSSLSLDIISPANCPDPLPEVVEDGDSFLENAIKKAIAFSKFAEEKIGDDAWALADDSGLCVDALNGEPGVYSARYANSKGVNRDQENNEKLLKQLTGIPDEQRAASFWCIIAIAYRGEVLLAVEGSVQGRILEKAKGKYGFGYDPLFYHLESQQSFAEMAREHKEKISHRGNAIEKLKYALADILPKHA